MNEQNEFAFVPSIESKNEVYWWQEWRKNPEQPETIAAELERKFSEIKKQRELAENIVEKLRGSNE